MKSSAEPASLPAGAESPEYVRLSLAAAMTLGFVPGWFYRNARLGCINLLLTYDHACRANCAFCGLAAGKVNVHREGDDASESRWGRLPEKEAPSSSRNFIRVPWRTFPLKEVVRAIKHAPGYVGRVCVSMITHPRCKGDVLHVCRAVAQETGKSVSLLISPTLLHRDDLVAMRDAGADRIGVAVDAATPELFDRLRGKPVGGPHRWEKYWEIYEQSIDVFGQRMAGVHLISGLGETEQELVETIFRAREMGGSTHLFSFFPERGSIMQDQAPPPMGTYRRIQLARWFIDHDQTRPAHMHFDSMGRIADFGVAAEEVDQAVTLGEAFQTSGCPGPDGKVACNRPYGNEKPGPCIRNFPFPPDSDDIQHIRQELGEY